MDGQKARQGVGELLSALSGLESSKATERKVCGAFWASYVPLGLFLVGCNWNPESVAWQLVSRIM